MGGVRLGYEIHQLAGCLRDVGARPIHRTHSAVEEELVVLRGDDSATYHQDVPATHLLELSNHLSIIEVTAHTSLASRPIQGEEKGPCFLYVRRCVIMFEIITCILYLNVQEYPFFPEYREITRCARSGNQALSSPLEWAWIRG